MAVTTCLICNEALGYTINNTSRHRKGSYHVYGVWVVAHRLDYVFVRDNELPMLGTRKIQLELLQAPIFWCRRMCYHYKWARRSDLIQYLSDLESTRPLPKRLQQLLARAKDPNSNGNCYVGR